MPSVNPQMLSWARERAGLPVDAAARAIGLSGVSAPARLAEMERGERAPTHRQLAGMAGAYRRPLLTFYLSVPPAADGLIADFRRHVDRTSEAEANVQALLREVKARQALLRAAMEEAEEAEPITFVGSATLEMSARDLAMRIGVALAFDRTAYRAARDVNAAFTALRAAVEAAGVFVLLRGDLGHHTSRIAATAFRGMAIADPVAPFVVVNPNDARAAWSFTLLHEVCHLLLGESGVSGYESDRAVERLCDAAAAAFLLEPREIDRIVVRDDASVDDLTEAVEAFALPRHVSRTMVAYQLLRTGRIDRAAYDALTARYRTARSTKPVPTEDTGGPNYYTVMRHRVGPRLLDVTRRMVGESLLTSTKAAKVLGVKPTAVGRMLGAAR